MVYFQVQPYYVLPLLGSISCLLGELILTVTVCCGIFSGSTLLRVATVGVHILPVGWTYFNCDSMFLLVYFQVQPYYVLPLFGSLSCLLGELLTVTVCFGIFSGSALLRVATVGVHILPVGWTYFNRDSMFWLVYFQVQPYYVLPLFGFISCLLGELILTVTVCSGIFSGSTLLRVATVGVHILPVGWTYFNRYSMFWLVYFQVQPYYVLPLLGSISCLLGELNLTVTVCSGIFSGSTLLHVATVGVHILLVGWTNLKVTVCSGIFSRFIPTMCYHCWGPYLACWVN